MKTLYLILLAVGMFFLGRWSCALEPCAKYGSGPCELAQYELCLGDVDEAIRYLRICGGDDDDDH
jgi:hypothetical protein